MSCFLVYLLLWFCLGSQVQSGKFKAMFICCSTSFCKLKLEFRMYNSVENACCTIYGAKCRNTCYLRLWNANSN